MRGWRRKREWWQWGAWEDGRVTGVGRRMKRAYLSKRLGQRVIRKVAFAPAGDEL